MTVSPASPHPPRSRELPKTGKAIVHNREGDGMKSMLYGGYDADPSPPTLPSGRKAFHGASPPRAHRCFTHAGIWCVRSPRETDLASPAPRTSHPTSACRSPTMLTHPTIPTPFIRSPRSHRASLRHLRRRERRQQPVPIPEARQEKLQIRRGRGEGWRGRRRRSLPAVRVREDAGAGGGDEGQEPVRRRQHLRPISHRPLEARAHSCAR